MTWMFLGLGGEDVFYSPFWQLQNFACFTPTYLKEIIWVLFDIKFSSKRCFSKTCTYYIYLEVFMRVNLTWTWEYLTIGSVILALRICWDEQICWRELLDWGLGVHWNQSSMRVLSYKCKVKNDWTVYIIAE